MKSKQGGNNNLIKIKNKGCNSSGITLIALVVTIIVLIILAGISINLILGDNGIILKAKGASKAQEIAELKETLQMEIVSKEMQKLQNGQEIAQSEIESIIKVKCGEEAVVRNEDGTIKSVKPEGKDYEIPFEEIYEGIISAKISVSELKVGDYIKYDTGVTTVGQNGVIICRVLYNDEKNGLQIISDKNVIAELELGGVDWVTGKAAYNNVIEDLNDEAEKYLNKTYAVDARCVGSLPEVNVNGIFTQKDKGTEITVSIPSNWSKPTGWIATNTGCYDLDKNYKSDETAMKAVNIWITKEFYYLASRDVISNSTNLVFCVRRVNTSGELYDDGLCNVGSGGGTVGDLYKRGLRPCFSLKSDIKITGGDGTSEDTAYTM